MKTGRNTPVLLVSLTLFVAGCGLDSSATKPNASPAVPNQQEVQLRHLKIPKRENGYNNFEACLLGSEAEVKSFLATVSGQEGWNNRDLFISVLSTAKIDFTKSSLLLVRHTEGSGSVRVWLEPAVIRSDELLVRIGKEVPSVGTLDMAYYCFALAVPREIAQRVRITGSFTPSRMVLTEGGKETLRPWHQDDIVFNL